ncbi:MAG: Non-canonical purine NTP pyrophosphatase [Candidatus Magasanikbacteria bacterium GW2011_GWC2_37_14]|uniref:dITP/XTP pyrophosphatase n=1 Tax=Candidatus Magasanikbacteria bacterium GW2011_GWC2_37_14 TaxID=1619046 RepID=A0A0G0JJ75_9BACT|nr:MAG: Non-canonical purine NTP pyrophosphatase [Candidatus Magasanikbacteria bacterium GW2011_GWC2_37_14]
MQKVLIATTNQGKFNETKEFLSDLAFNFISLNDLNKKISPPEENEDNLEKNAMSKAVYYGEKTGLITLCDDSGLFVKTLKNFPGIYSARIAKTDKERCKIILEKLKNKKSRSAIFALVYALYNPSNQDLYLASGMTKGKITEKEIGKNGFGYDQIFYVNEKKKTYAQMKIQEKNSCSHRAKALNKVKYFLLNQFDPKHIVVPFGIIVKEGKMLISLRNDPHRPKSHKKWEMPGGGVDFGDNVESTLLKEVKEETGYKIKIIKQLQGITVKSVAYPNYKYQVFLVPFVCKIISGKLALNSNEVLTTKWIKPNDYKNYKFLEGNNIMLKKLLPQLKQVIKDFKL